LLEVESNKGQRSESRRDERVEFLFRRGELSSNKTIVTNGKYALPTCYLVGNGYEDF